MTGEIYVLNTIAWDAAGYLTDMKKRELDEKFPPFFMYLCEQSIRDAGKNADKIRGVLDQISAASVYCAEMGRGGIFNALWNMAEELGTGLETGLKKIPILQQTVEILELFDINPYYARSRGTWLAVTKDPADLGRILNREFIPYEVIGCVNEGKARTIKNGESIRYLDRPQREELEKISGFL